MIEEVWNTDQLTLAISKIGCMPILLAPMGQRHGVSCALN